MRSVKRDGLPTIEEMVNALPRPLDDGIKGQLIQYISNLHEAYEEKAESSKLYELRIDKLTCAKPDVFTDEKAINWYEHIRKESKGIFSRFPITKNMNNNAICPICEGVLSTRVTLEHIIPKGKYGEYRLAILPINLMKCCEECNTAKHIKKSDCESNSEINLYYERFGIDKFIKVYFIKSSSDFTPNIKFQIENKFETIQEHRVAHFIDIYNLEKTYNHRLKLEYQKIVTVLSNNPSLSKKSLLISYLENERDSYKQNSESERFDDCYWLDQNYFGYLICDELINIANIDNQSEFNRFVEFVQQFRASKNYIVTENPEFFEQLEGVREMGEVAQFVCDNKRDILVYYKDCKKHNRKFEFPNLCGEDKRKKRLLNEIIHYCLEVDQYFERLEESIRWLID